MFLEGTKRFLIVRVLGLCYYFAFKFCVSCRTNCKRHKYFNFTYIKMALTKILMLQVGSIGRIQISVRLFDLSQKHTDIATQI
jgi:hypothetical protein